jgi:M6 family metalloprotease-like protein
MEKSRYWKTASFLIISLLLFTAQSFARPLREDIRQKLIEEGKYSEYLTSMSDARARGVDAPSRIPYHRQISLGAGPDTMRAVVLLLEFPDHPADDGSGPFVDSAYFNRLFNYEGLLPDSGAYRSMHDFYEENSYGQFVFIADVYGWYMMNSTYAYYVDEQKGFGDYPQNAQRLAEDAVALVDPDVDFSLYDRSGDNYVDALILVHSGPGYEETGDVNDIHSHKWFFNTEYTSDDGGVKIREYNINPEETAQSGPYGNEERYPIKVGVFCHEFGHTIGLPDLYDTDYSSEGVGDWSLMASGSYNGKSAIPAGLDAWCKYDMGWITPENIAASQIEHAIPDIFSTGYAARLWTDGNGSGAEYYLLENRLKMGFDSMLPGQGLLIWHVDETNWSNNHEYNYHVALEQADGSFHLERNRNQGDAADPYPGTGGVREFSETTIPGSFANPYNPDSILQRDTTYVAVWNISDPGSIMYANLDVNYTRPRYKIVEHSLTEVAGDGDNYVEAGETWGLGVKVANMRADGQDVSLSFSIDDESIQVPVSSVLMGDLPAGDTIDNQAQLLEFSVPGDVESMITMVHFEVTDLGQTDSTFGSFKLTVGNPRILIVARDDNDYYNYEHYYTDVLDSLQTPYVLYEYENLGTPAGEYSSFPIIIWFISQGTLDSADMDFLETYLDQGGRLFLTGQNIAEGLYQTPDSLFLKDYLKCTFMENGGMFDPMTAYGVDGSFVGADSVKFQFTGADGANNQSSFDVLTNIDPAAVVSLSYSSNMATLRPAAIEYAGDDYRLVFLGFGFEGITSTLSYKNTRMDAMQRILDFLDNISTDAEDDFTIANQLPKEFALNQNYPNPFNPRTLISYELNRNMDNVILKVYNLLGQEVKTLVDKAQDAGVYRVEWDGTDESGSPMATGVYFYRLQAGDQTQTRKMVLLK